MPLTLQKMQLSSPCAAEMPSAIALTVLLGLIDDLARTDGADRNATRLNGNTAEDKRATSRCERTRQGNEGAEASMG